METYDKADTQRLMTMYMETYDDVSELYETIDEVLLEKNNATNSFSLSTENMKSSNVSCTHAVNLFMQHKLFSNMHSCIQMYKI